MGIVYVLSNKSMPGMVKIGITNKLDMRDRLSGLFSTGVPLPFKCELAFEVDDEAAVERALHDVLDRQRVNPNREFFKVESDKLRPILELLGAEITQGGWYDGIDATSRLAVETFTDGNSEEDPYRSFLRGTSNILRTEHNFPRPREIRRRHWNFRSGFRRIHYNVGFHSDGRHVRVRLSIFMDGKDFARRLYDLLEEKKKDIDKELDLEDLRWEPETEPSECMITAYTLGSISDSDEELLRTRDWLVATAVKFMNVFTPHLRRFEPTSRKT